MIVHLELLTWKGLSSDAQHYYGTLKGYLDEKLGHVSLSRKLTTRGARALTKADHQTCGGSFVWSAGMETERFDNRESVIELAIATYKTHFPAATVLVLGDIVYCEPQTVLDGPAEYMKAVNRLAAKADKIGRWDNLAAMDKICDEWTALKTSYGLK